jgi:hypothetical protein
MVSAVRNAIKKYVLKSKGEERHPSDGNSVGSLPGANLKSFSPKSIAKQSIRNVNYYFNYILRYKIGRIAPKARRPQTMIVIAKKSSQNDLTDNSQIIR